MRVPMPEASIDEHNCAPSRKSHIWATRKVSTEKTESEPQVVCGTPYSQLGLGVLPAYGPHVTRSRLICGPQCAI